MRYLLIMLLSATCFAAEPLEQVRARAEEQFRRMPEMSCFRYGTQQLRRHRWEKDALTYGPYWVLLKKDGMGLLVAQPSNNCEEDHNYATACPFWIRTVDYKDMFLEPDMTLFACPSKFTKKYFQGLIKNSHYREVFQLD